MDDRGDGHNDGTGIEQAGPFRAARDGHQGADTQDSQHTGNNGDDSAHDHQD